MPRPRKFVNNRDVTVPLSFRVPLDFYIKFKEYCNKKNMTISDYCLNALRNELVMDFELGLDEEAEKLLKLLLKKERR